MIPNEILIIQAINLEIQILIHYHHHLKNIVLYNKSWKLQF